MTPVGVGNERRGDAPHPGPLIKREYVDALGIAMRDLAAHIDMSVERLEAMLDGSRSIDVDKKKRPRRRGLFLVRYRLNVRRAADDHFARRAHAVILVAVCVGGGNERIFIGTGNARSAKRARHLFRHVLSSVRYAIDVRV